MPSFTPVSTERHASWTWHPATEYSFAATDIVIPVLPQDLAGATVTFPLAFIQQDAGFVPVMVVGLTPGKNLFVSPDGRWMAGMVPTRLRTHPFALAQDQTTGNMILCIDEETGLARNDPSGNPFFVDDQLSEPTAAMLKLLQDVELGAQRMHVMTTRLREAGLIIPWTQDVPQTDTSILRLLHRMDEQAFNALDAEQFLDLREHGAILLAYCQLLSMQHLPTLIARNARTNAPGSKPMVTVDINAVDNDTFNFDFLRSTK